MAESIRVYSYSSCSTCRKALKWLAENKIAYELIDIVKKPPHKELISMALLSLEKRKSIFNTNGLSYRTLGAKLVNSMSDEEAINALVSDGKLIKRPFLVHPKGTILLGFKPDEWSNVLLG